MGLEARLTPDRTKRFFRHEMISQRRLTFLSLAGQIGSQLRDAYDKKHRKEGLTQTSIASVLGIDKSAVNHRLRGLVNMTIESIADMVWALGYEIRTWIYDPHEFAADAFAELAVRGDGPALSELPHPAYIPAQVASSSPRPVMTH